MVMLASLCVQARALGGILSLLAVSCLTTTRRDKLYSLCCTIYAGCWWSLLLLPLLL